MGRGAGEGHDRAGSFGAEPQQLIQQAPRPAGNKAEDKRIVSSMGWCSGLAMLGSSRDGVAVFLQISRRGIDDQTRFSTILWGVNY